MIAGHFYPLSIRLGIGFTQPLVPQSEAYEFAWDFRTR